MKCKHCGASLDSPHAVEYVERCRVRMASEVDGQANMVPSSHTVDSSAQCTECGHELAYALVEFVGYPSNSLVQAEHFVAASGTSVRQNGHSLVVTFSGPGLCSLLSPLTTKKTTPATSTKLTMALMNCP